MMRQAQERQILLAIVIGLAIDVSELTVLSCEVILQAEAKCTSSTTQKQDCCLCFLGNRNALNPHDVLPQDGSAGHGGMLTRVATAFTATPPKSTDQRATLVAKGRLACAALVEGKVTHGIARCASRSVGMTCRS